MPAAPRTDGLPTELTANSWDGQGPVSGRLAKSPYAWIHRKAPLTFPSEPLLYDEEDDKKWRDPNIGWGLVLPAGDGLTDAQRALPVDAPRPIQKLWADRGSPPIYRFDPKRAKAPDKLMRYAPDAAPHPVHATRRNHGTAPDKLPFYLLIYARPDQIPWGVQFMLNANHAVGRLDLTVQEGLGRYVKRLIEGWPDDVTDGLKVVTWAVDDGDKITPLMRKAVAERIHAGLHKDIRTKPMLAGADATGANLIRHLREIRPGLIVTTSHGAVDKTPVAERKTTLGLLVDQKKVNLWPRVLLRRWQPDGAVWYAHACCSAGGDAVNRYAGLFQANAGLDAMLGRVKELGAMVAPFPRALLGATKPLRAFIGHVDPTFNWTIQDKDTQTYLTDELEQAAKRFYLKKPAPVGYAFRPLFNALGGILTAFEQFQDQYYHHQSDAIVSEFDHKLMALDIQSTVILGDPTVARPASPGRRRS
jgi:hypothetical protein